MNSIVLASGSRYRAQLLKNAGVDFSTHPATIDEREVEAPLLEAGMNGADIAEVLAIAKATQVSERFPGDYVIGCDQTLSLEDKLLHKPEDMEAARRRLLALSGKTHHLNSSVVIVKDGAVLWSHVELCAIEFRKLDPGFIGRHLAQVGDVAQTSVGAYQIEGPGVQLFEKISGDYFSIMGLPLLQLLKELRNLELLPN